MVWNISLNCFKCHLKYLNFMLNEYIMSLYYWFISKLSVIVQINLNTCNKLSFSIELLIKLLI